ncbi:MAG TPA: hypothetical protein VGQ66_02805 [Candidatus Limnocylindria bacterium]|jgi:hypothetical protein|nr:hypothetical protein [Candidatus Limnocylindria bacterium]
MPTTRPDAARRRRAIQTRHVTTLSALLLIVAGCTFASPTPTPSPSPVPTPVATPTPEPTPEPTPIFTNVPDPALVALIPTEAAGQVVQIPAITEFSITPGDIGEVYGEIGARFRSLQIAYISRPRLSLYAMRMNPPTVTTADLKPYLAAAAEYVGIAGLHPEAWKLQTVAAHVVWVRPEDNATLPGTRVYSWVADDLVFLMIGVDEAQNLAMLAGLPGEAPPTPSPVPSTIEIPSVGPSAS